MRCLNIFFFFFIKKYLCTRSWQLRNIYDPCHVELFQPMLPRRYDDSVPRDRQVVEVEERGGGRSKRVFSRSKLRLYDDRLYVCTRRYRVCKRVERVHTQWRVTSQWHRSRKYFCTIIFRSANVLRQVEIGSKVASSGTWRGAWRDVIFSDPFNRRDSREFLKVTRAFDARTFLNPSPIRKSTFSRVVPPRNFSLRFGTRTNHDPRGESANWP